MFFQVSERFRRWWQGRRRGAGRELELARQVQEYRLALEERDQAVRRLGADLDKARRSSAEEAAHQGQAEVGQLVEAMGASLVQLVTQAELHRGGTVRVR